ncbi:hypothetical protein ACTFIW_007798 [Dictyostelium discoideum]
MDEHIIRLYEINGKEAIQINGRWLDVLGYSELATQADSLGIPQALTHCPKIQIYNKVLSLVKETREESEVPVDLIPCDCLICLKGLPKSFKSGDSGGTIQIWQERLKIIMFVLCQQQEKHGKELEKELQDRGFKKNSSIKKILGSKKSYVHINEITYFLDTHSCILKVNLEDSWKSALVNGKDFISGFDKFNIKGYWTLANLEDPFSPTYNFVSNSSAVLPNTNSDNNNDKSNNNNNNYSMVVYNRKPCAKIGFCSFHMIRKLDGTFEFPPSMNNNNNNNNNKLNIYSENNNNKNNSDEDIDTDTDSGSDEYRNKAQNYISQTTFKVRELEKRILDNFNFYRFILKFEQYGYRLPREFVRFIALKVICDETGENHESTILQPPKLIEEFWIQIILTSLEYNRLLKIINVEKIRYDPDLLLDEHPVQRKRYEKTLQLYKKYFRFDKFDSEIWKENYLLESND